MAKNRLHQLQDKKELDKKVERAVKEIKEWFDTNKNVVSLRMVRDIWEAALYEYATDVLHKDEAKALRWVEKAQAQVEIEQQYREKYMMSVVELIRNYKGSIVA